MPANMFIKIHVVWTFIKISTILIRNKCPKRPFSESFLTLSKCYYVSFGFDPPPPFHLSKCLVLICDRRSVAFTPHPMVCLVL